MIRMTLWSYTNLTDVADSGQEASHKWSLP
jgi:hypothetical protein